MVTRKRGWSQMVKNLCYIILLQIVWRDYEMWFPGRCKYYIQDDTMARSHDVWWRKHLFGFRWLVSVVSRFRSHRLSPPPPLHSEVRSDARNRFTRKHTMVRFAGNNINKPTLTAKNLVNSENPLAVWPSNASPRRFHVSRSR